MVDVRCRDLDSDLWTYVVEYARIRKMSRCKALEQIILEHMKFIYKEHITRIGEQQNVGR